MRVPFVLKAAATCLIVFSAWADRFERSQSKNTMNDGGARPGARGGRDPAGGTCIAHL
jgi:hypothetical protein